jgi:cytoskeletal protein CcmA (bactofilin family)
MNSTLDVTGSAQFKSTLQVNSTSELKGAVGMNSTLDVTGSAQFKSTINVDGEATLSSATVEDLTQDRIVGVGSGGSLIDYSGLTYNGTTLKVGGGLFEVDNSDGDVRTSGSLTTNGLTNNGDLTVNGILTVTGNTQLQANLYVSGNLEVLGSSTNLIIQSQTVEIADNIIRLNSYSPFQRYAGFEVMDSGSTGVSASLVWDSLQDYWMFVSSSGDSSKLIGTTAGAYGSETNLTSGTFPIATGNSTIGDSLLKYSGTTLSFNTNKFTIDSGTGDTLVSGNFTLSYSGGTDNGTKTSAIMFRNSSNVVGFVSTTETTDVLDGILGYKQSGGGLTFSTVIDGGTY